MPLDSASGSSTAAPTAVRANTRTGTETPSTATLIIRYGMPQMMLIAMNNSHPRELTSTTLRVGSEPSGCASRLGALSYRAGLDSSAYRPMW